MPRLRPHGHDDNGVKKGPWSAEEDEKLIAYIKRYGIWNWTYMPGPAGLARTGKSCRLRWVNYLRPNIKRGNFTKEEEDTIIMLQQRLGNRWSAIAAKLPGRTDNEVKNYWNARLRKRFSSNNIKANTTKDTPNLQDTANVNDVEQRPQKEITDTLIPLVPKKDDAQEDSGFGGLPGDDNFPIPHKLFSAESSSSNSATSFYDLSGNNQTCLLDVDHDLQNLCFEMFQVEDICMVQNFADSRETSVPSLEWQHQSEFSNSIHRFQDFLFDL